MANAVRLNLSMNEKKFLTVIIININGQLSSRMDPKRKPLELEKEHLEA